MGFLGLSKCWTVRSRTCFRYSRIPFHCLAAEVNTMFRDFRSTSASPAGWEGQFTKPNVSEFSWAADLLLCTEIQQLQ